ncbi:hypothetical protein B0H14DRAFT_2607319 [Mycena olivaceomarginata]|nr:hypothetical protein B0H14DRAFT_2607319 [Mycena olivaceomarginata]
MPLFTNHHGMLPTPSMRLSDWNREQGCRRQQIEDADRSLAIPGPRLTRVAPHSTTATQAKELLRTHVVPYLKARFAPDTAKSTPLPSAIPALLTPWAAATTALVSALPTEALFPLVDMWRLAVLDPAAAAWLAAAPGGGPVEVFSRTARDTLAQPTQDKGATTC